MSNTSDLDLPLLPSAEQIRRREFASVRRGYDPDQVRDYLGAVATQVETLEQDLREARLTAETTVPAPAATATAPAPKTDPYEELGKRIAGLVATADQEAIRLVDEAKTESSRILQEARTDADRIRTDAQSHAEEVRQQAADVLAEAQAKADAIVAGLAERRENLVTQLQTMQSRLLNVAKELDVTIEDGGTSASASVSASPAPEPSVTAPVSEEPAPAPATEAPPRARTDAAAVAEGDDLADLVDPRYEDLWVSADAATAETTAETDTDTDASTGDAEIDLPDLASMELDFDSDDD
ncbi:MAG: DivIVA domain-containing protein [Actinomycetota bacterium]